MMHQYQYGIGVLVLVLVLVSVDIGITTSAHQRMKKLNFENFDKANIDSDSLTPKLFSQVL